MSASAFAASFPHCHGLPSRRYSCQLSGASIPCRRIRFHGIDAPESRQLCRLDGKPWQCGEVAANALADKIARRSVTCEDLGRDRYKRIIARCAVADEDIGA